MKIRVFFIVCFSSVLAVKAQKPALKDNTVYFLSSVYKDKKKVEAGREQSHLVFDFTKKIAVCFTSCNFMKLDFVIKGNNLNFTSVIPDKEPCLEPHTILEEIFKVNFSKVTNYSLSKSELILFNQKDTLMVFHEKKFDPNGK